MNTAVSAKAFVSRYNAGSLLHHASRSPYSHSAAFMTSNSSPSSTSPVPSIAIWALSLAAFGSAISLRLTDALLPRLASEFSLTLGTASYVITCFSIAYGISQLFFGPLGDRFGKYRVIAWACMACAATAASCGLAPSFSMLLVARLFAGATAAAIIPLSMAWIGDVVPYDQRQPILARFLIGQILGVSAGVLLGGFAADHLSWRDPFFGIAACFVLISLILLLLNRRLPAHARTMHKAEGHALQRMFNEFRQVVTVPWARVVLTTVFLEGAFFYGAFAFIASHLHRVHGISLSQAGTLVMLFGVGGFLFAATATILVKRLGEVGLARWGGIFIFLSLSAVGFSPSWQWAVPGCLGAGLGFYMLHNTLQINATQMAPDRRGAAVAAFASSYFLGQSVGVASIGFLVEHIGTGPAIAVGAAGALVVAIKFSQMRARRLNVVA
jgi:predicted MFS family arabinose efflux permease